METVHIRYRTGLGAVFQHYLSEVFYSVANLNIDEAMVNLNKYPLQFNLRWLRAGREIHIFSGWETSDPLAVIAFPYSFLGEQAPSDTTSNAWRTGHHL